MAGDCIARLAECDVGTAVRACQQGGKGPVFRVTAKASHHLMLRPGALLNGDRCREPADRSSFAGRDTGGGVCASGRQAAVAPADRVAVWAVSRRILLRHMLRAPGMGDRKSVV